MEVRVRKTADYSQYMVYHFGESRQEFSAVRLSRQNGAGFNLTATNNVFDDLIRYLSRALLTFIALLLNSMSLTSVRDVQMLQLHECSRVGLVYWSFMIQSPHGWPEDEPSLR